MQLWRPEFELDGNWQLVPLLTNKDISLITKPPGMQASIFGACPKPG